jgi:hypothetical protein
VGIDVRSSEREEREGGRDRYLASERGGGERDRETERGDRERREIGEGGKEGETVYLASSPVRSQYFFAGTSDGGACRALTIFNSSAHQRLQSTASSFSASNLFRTINGGACHAVSSRIQTQVFPDSEACRGNYSQFGPFRPFDHYDHMTI